MQSSKSLRIAAGAVAWSLAATGVVSAATNFVWTGANGDGSYSTSGNWTRLDTGAAGVPGSVGNAILADAIFDNISGWSFTPGAGGVITVPAAGITLGTLSFGDSISTKGIFTLSNDLTVGTPGTTITLNTGLARLGPGTDALAGGSNVGNTYSGTTGKQTINSNLVIIGSQSWSIKGDGGSLVLNGTVNNAAGQTITKSGGNRIEFAADNSASFLGSYVAQGGDTVISNSNALGLGSSVVQVSGTGTGVIANASLLTNTGVTFTHDVNVNTNPNGVTVNLGGLGSQTNSTWTGSVALGQNVSLTGGTAGTTTFTGTISGPSNAAVNKSGNGTVILAGNNTYTGQTNVSAGTLQIDGQQTGGGAYSVASGAALRGLGTLTTGTSGDGLTVQTGGTFAPAFGGGTLTVQGDVTLNGTLSINLDSATSSYLAVTGALSIGEGASLVFSGGSALSADVYPIGTYTTLTGSWSSDLISNLPAGYQLVANYDNGNELALVRSDSAPEPASWLAGVVVAGLTLRRRRSATASK